ncbi:PREDICTED: probable E3 ubiquitin-protein ligase ARI7 isoform X2 [Cyprinodon variegatus]|uniref:probable E3 ubiquitin-protein ligase ARI7 isoform X2 n=1 Tax=Cyprinodon variegatus TaxID=28743 RepID=UPI000742B201|nr:PREDICTED: probable E3 ubiquitin-protein ligase ARI7 isoform X2 [Cyprinodon variegatus]
MSSPAEDDKRYDPRDTTFSFVDRPDDLDPLFDEDEDQGLRAEMSCGHAVTPQSLTGWCRSLLDQGQYKFRCPAIDEETQEKCGAQWSYREVRRLADLSVEEMNYFEENIARLAAAEYQEFRACLVCAADKKKVFQFCWQCSKPWKGPAPRSDRCGNDGCINRDLELLRTCKTTTLLEVQGVDACPSIRACPTCGNRVEHDNTGCKNIICPRCQVEFCFVCLKLTPECLETSTHFMPCSDGVAPRQTSIPVWRRK